MINFYLNKKIKLKLIDNICNGRIGTLLVV